MANKLMVHEQEAIRNLTALGWGIRRIARDLKVSRNTVRNYVRTLEPADPGPIAEQILKSAPLLSPGSGIQTDPLSTPGAVGEKVQTDPLSPPGKTGRQSLCFVHADWILQKVETGLTAQRIYQDLRLENAFTGSYQSVKRYVHKVRQTDPKLVQRIEVQPGEEVQVDFGTGPTLAGAEGKKRKTWIFRIVLSHSRKAYSEAVLRQDTETFVRCLENAFRYFGGGGFDHQFG